MQGGTQITLCCKQLDIEQMRQKSIIATANVRGNVHDLWHATWLESPSLAVSPVLSYMMQGHRIL